MKRLALYLASLCAFATLMANPVSATYNQTTFQIGGYGVFADAPDTTRLKLLNGAGVDWVNLFSEGFAPRNTQLNSRIDGLRANMPGFLMRNVASYRFPESDPARLDMNTTVPINANTIRASLDPTAGLNSSSTAGWSVWDEPCESQWFDNLGTVSKVIDTCSVCTDKVAYVNLYPIYAYNSDPTTCYSQNFGTGTGQPKASGYISYVRTFLSQFDSHTRPAQILSFDHYNFQLPNAPQNDWFFNLRIIRDLASEYSRPNQRIPFWVVLQLSPFKYPSDQAYPANFTFTNTRWQVWTALAYGVKGISYWMLTDGHNPYEDWDSGILKPNGDTVAVRYSQLRALNGEVHKLGPILMKLDPVTAIHQSALGDTGIAHEVLSSTRKVYNIISSFGAASDSVMAGYLKDRENGDDYLLVVNKALIQSKSFTINLTNRADSVMLVSRATGTQSLIIANSSSFTTSILPPGQGELYRILDQTYEYIPNVNVTQVAGSRQYYGHDKGVVMVDRSSSRRAYHVDGWVFTPVSDLAVSNSRVFIAQDNGISGSYIRTGLNFEEPTLLCWSAGRPSAVTVQATESLIVVIDRKSSTTSRVRVFSSNMDSLTSITFNDGTGPPEHPSPNVAYDVQYQEGLGSFVVAHGRSYTRIRSTPPYNALASAWYRVQTPTKVRLATLGVGTSQLLFAGRNEGTIGGVEKMNYNLVKPSPNGWWPAGGTQPSVKDIYASGNHVMFCSTSPGGDFFVRLRALDLWALGYRQTSAPRMVALNPDSSALMGNGPGIARSSLTGLAGRYAAEPAPHSAPDSLDASELPLVLAFSVGPNPSRREAMVHLELPKPGQVEIAAFDVQGRRIAQLVRSRLAAGRYDLPWTAPQSGVYFLRMRSGEKEFSKKIVIR